MTTSPVVALVAVASAVHHDDPHSIVYRNHCPVDGPLARTAAVLSSMVFMLDPSVSFDQQTCSLCAGHAIFDTGGQGQALTALMTPSWYELSPSPIAARERRRSLREPVLDHGMRMPTTPASSRPLPPSEQMKPYGRTCAGMARRCDRCGPP